MGSLWSEAVITGTREGRIYINGKELLADARMVRIIAKRTALQDGIGTVVVRVDKNYACA